MSKGICCAQNLNITPKEETFNEIAILHAKTPIVIANCN
ncbi:hypothetical protein LINPERHAP1_LOCUS28193 [Linum perenne]